MANSTVNPLGITIGGADVYNSPAGIETVFTTNNRGDHRVVQSMLPGAELTRMGNSWDVRIASGSAFTFVAALPTTRAELVLWNGEPTGGKSYIVDQVYCLAITSIAAAASISIIGQLVAGGSAPTDDTAQLITSRSGKASYVGNAKRAVAQTTMTANKWSVLSTSISGGSATAQIGLASVAEVAGKIIIPPSGLFGVNAIAGSAAGTGIMGITWHEVQLTLG